MKSFRDLREKTLTSAEKKKREEIAKAMERENPGMDMGKKMAIATWQAKKVAEEANLEEGLYHVEYGRSGRLTHQVVATDANDAHKKAMAHLKKKNPKLAHPDYADTFKKPSVTHIKGNEPRADKYKTEATEIDEISLSHLSNTIAKSTLDEGAKTHFVYQKGAPKTKEVVHRGTEQSSKDWITKNAKHYAHKGKDFVIYKGKYPNVKPSDSLNFKHVAEEVQIDEGIENMPHGRLKWHMNTGVPHGRYTKAELKKERDDRLSKVDTGTAYKKAKPSMYEESLDITEISLDMLTKKITNTGLATTKKANKFDKTKKDLEAMKARLAGKTALAKEAYEDDELDEAQIDKMKFVSKGFNDRQSAERHNDRLVGNKKASHQSYVHDHSDGKFYVVDMKEAKEDDEPASPDEASMALKQLEFIEYAAEEMMDHIKSGKEFPEWFQNKLSKAHGEIEGLHSSMGEHGGDEEDMKEAVRRKGAPKMKGDFVAIQRAKDAELNKALGRTKTGRKKPERTMTSTQRSLAQLRGESVMSADKKPEKYIKPDGKVGIRMVRTDKNVLDKDA